MQIGNFKLDVSQDGEVRGISMEFDPPSYLEEIFFSTDSYKKEIHIIDEIQKQLREEKTKLRHEQLEFESKGKREVRLLQKIAELEGELEELRNARTI